MPEQAGTLGATFDPLEQGEVIPTVDEAPGYDPKLQREASIERFKMEEIHRNLLEEHEASILEGISGAWRFDTGTGAAIANIQDYNQAVDINFNVEEAIQQDTEEFPIKQGWEAEILREAKSPEHYEILKERIRDKREFMLNAQDLGVLPSMALQLVAEFGNIPNYFGFGLGGLSKVNKARRFMLAGMAMGSLNTAEENYIGQAFKDKSVSELVSAGAMGFGMGWLGTLGGAGDAALAKHIDDVGEDFANVHIKNEIDESLSDLKESTSDTPESTVGAQQLPSVHKILNPKYKEGAKVKSRIDPDDPIVQDTVRATLEGVIPKADKLIHEKLGLNSLADSIMRSDNKITRYLGSKLFEHPENVKGFADHTAALEADLDFTKFTATYAPEYIRLKAAYNMLRKDTDSTYNFDEAATAWIEGSGAVQGVTPQMQDILKSFDEFYTNTNKATHDIMKESGVMEAAGDLKDDFLARSWDSEKFVAMRNKHGDDVVLKTLQESILEGNAFKSMYAKADAEYKIKLENQKAKVVELEAKLSKINASSKQGLNIKARILKTQDNIAYEPPDVEASALRMAQALYNRFLNRATVTTADANLLSSANRTLLNSALDDLKLNKADRMHIDRILDTAGKDHAASPFMHQMGMKLAHRNDSGLRIMDLMYSDLGSAFQAKHRYWLGRSAAARKGIQSEAMFNKGVEQMKMHGQDIRQDPKATQADVARMQAGWKMLMGQPIEDMSARGMRNMRIVRKAMAASSLGKLGIVQAGETGRVMAAVGINTLWKGIPFLKDLATSIATGKYDVATVKNIEEFAVGKIGADHYMNHPDFRAEDFGHRVSKGEQQLDKASFWLSKASGWHRVHTLQKKFLMNGLAQKWRRELMNGTMSEVQLRVNGVPPDQMPGLQRMMQKHSTSDGHLHLENWEPELRRTFALMLHRKSANAVQDLLVGETPLWINAGVGKFMGQFRSFSIAALAKQTTRDIRMYKQGDPEAALAFNWMLATSSLAVMARTAFDTAATAEDRKLSKGQIVKKILDYHGQVGPLVDAVDFLGSSFMPNAWGQITGNSMYRGGRGLMDKIPGVSYINRAYKGTTGIVKGTLPGEKLRKSDWNAFVGALPLSSWYGFHVLNKRVLTPMIFNEEK